MTVRSLQTSKLFTQYIAPGIKKVSERIVEWIIFAIFMAIVGGAVVLKSAPARLRTVENNVANISTDIKTMKAVDEQLRGTAQDHEIRLQLMQSGQKYSEESLKRVEAGIEEQRRLSERILLTLQKKSQ